MSPGDFDQANVDVGEAVKMLNAAMAADARQSMYRRALFIGYTLKAGLQDDDESPCLGNPAEALVWAEKALALTEDVVKADPHDAQGKGAIGISCEEARQHRSTSLASGLDAIAGVSQHGPLGVKQSRRRGRHGQQRFRQLHRLAIFLARFRGLAVRLQRIARDLQSHDQRLAIVGIFGKAGLVNSEGMVGVGQAEPLY